MLEKLVSHLCHFFHISRSQLRAQSHIVCFPLMFIEFKWQNFFSHIIISFSDLGDLTLRIKVTCVLFKCRQMEVLKTWLSLVLHADMYLNCRCSPASVCLGKSLQLPTCAHLLQCPTDFNWRNPGESCYFYSTVWKEECAVDLTSVWVAINYVHTFSCHS